MLLALLLAAQITSVADAGDERHPLQLDVEATYLHGRQETRITRETMTGLVDELHLQVFPLVLGSGMRIFPETDEPIRLELESSRPVGNGVVVQSYRVA